MNEYKLQILVFIANTPVAVFPTMVIAKNAISTTYCSMDSLVICPDKDVMDTEFIYVDNMRIGRLEYIACYEKAAHL